MNQHQRGFGGLQIVLVAAVIGIVSLAVPQYRSHVVKAKMTEAFKLAGESQAKLSEFYMVNGRFPRTSAEVSTVKATTLSAPEFVRDMVVDHQNQDHEVMVKVYLKDGVVENETGGEQFIYIAGDRSATAGYLVNWSCGAIGLNAALLPKDCSG